MWALYKVFQIVYYAVFRLVSIQIEYTRQYMVSIHIYILERNVSTGLKQL